MSQKIRVGILFGGKSAEHEVSLLSAKNVIAALDRSKYDPILIGIDKSGGWHLHKEAEYLLNPTNPKLIALQKQVDTVQIVPSVKDQPLKTSNIQTDLGKIDVIFPILHGTYGEDGTIQGLFKLLDIPFVGAGVLGSSVGMDKDVMKRLLRDAQIQIGKFITISKSDKLFPTYKEASEKLGSILFIKPANAGSSVGVSKVRSETEFKLAIEEAFKWDRKILIEEFIKGREIECAVLGNHDPIASIPGEIIPTHEFYSYEAKYLDENGAKVQIPAQISDSTIKLVQKIAIDSFKALYCEGMARVDVFLTDDNKVYVNEINTIPGFTNISMYPKMWAASGIEYSELIDKLLQLALERAEEEKNLVTSI